LLAQDERRGADTVAWWLDPPGRIAWYEAHGIGKKELKAKRYLE